MSTQLQDATITPTTDVVRCDVCQHPDDLHDVISRRYCAATKAGNVTRDCICAGQA